MNKEEVKQWLRIQIKSCIFKQHGVLTGLYYNKSYIRALKLSKITGQPVNKENFKTGNSLIVINMKIKHFAFYSTINTYLIENYSREYSDKYNIIKEVLNEYPEYNGL